MKKLIVFFSSILLVIICNLQPLSLNAQTRSREYIRQQIRQKGECRNVAITKRNGDLMLYGRNGWATTGCPSDLSNALSELHDKNEYIDDVQLTDGGSWLVLYGDNGIRWNNIPYSLERKLREFNSNREVITSVTFNDDNDWVVISTEHISASSSAMQDWIAEGMDYYGSVWAACVTDDALVVVYEKGFRTLGNIPSDLEEKLRYCSFDVYRLKIAGTAWFISDGKSRFNYNM